MVISLASNVEPPARDEKKSKSVTTFVSAKWEATPIVLELAEYMSGESSDLFWSFVDGINSLKTSLQHLGECLYWLSRYLNAFIRKACFILGLTLISNVRYL